MNIRQKLDALGIERTVFFDDAIHQLLDELLVLRSQAVHLRLRELSRAVVSEIAHLRANGAQVVSDTVRSLEEAVRAATIGQDGACPECGHALDLHRPEYAQCWHFDLTDPTLDRGYCRCTHFPVFERTGVA